MDSALDKQIGTPMEAKLQPSLHPGRRLLEWAALAALTVWMTWPGFHQGLGYIPEEVRRVAIAVDMAHTGDLNPHWFGHPASLLIYTLSAIYKLISLGSGISGGAWDWSNLRTTYLTDPSGMFLIGRGLTRAATVAAVITTLEVGARITRRHWALLAAVLTAINPIFITHAQRLRADHILTVFLLLGVAFLSSEATNNNRQRQRLRTAALGGLAITYKYLAASILVAQLVLIAVEENPMRRRRTSIRDILCVACLTSFVASPFLWIDLPSSLKDVAWEATKKGNGWNPFVTIEKIITQLNYGFGDLGQAALLTLAAFSLLKLALRGRSGIVQSLRSAGSNAYPALILSLTTYLGLAMIPTRWNSTWLAPAIPMLTLFLIRESVQASSYIGSSLLSIPRGGKQACRMLLVIGISAMIATSQFNEAKNIRSIRSGPSAMELAEEWIQANIPPRSRILLWQPVPDQDGFFPRILTPDAEILRINTQGRLERVCEGERINYYDTMRRLSEEKCFPRPRVRSQSPEDNPPDVDQINFLITSSRQKEKIILANISSQPLQPIAQFGRPHIRHRRNPPKKDSFPEGDYGMWRHIQIFAFSSSDNGNIINQSTVAPTSRSKGVHRHDAAEDD